MYTHSEKGEQNGPLESIMYTVYCFQTYLSILKVSGFMCSQSVPWSPDCDWREWAMGQTEVGRGGLKAGRYNVALGQTAEDGRMRLADRRRK